VVVNMRGRSLIATLGSSRRGPSPVCAGVCVCVCVCAYFVHVCVCVCLCACVDQETFRQGVYRYLRWPKRVRHTHAHTYTHTHTHTHTHLRWPVRAGRRPPQSRFGPVTEVIQWCYSGVTVVLQWCYSGVTVVLQLCYSDFPVI
jgi:hypothetical protein